MSTLDLQQDRKKLGERRVSHHDPNKQKKKKLKQTQDEEDPSKIEAEYMASLHSQQYEEIRTIPTGKYYNFRSPIVDKFDKNEHISKMNQD